MFVETYLNLPDDDVTKGGASTAHTQVQLLELPLTGVISDQTEVF